MTSPRVVSLLPSTTEIVCALGCESQLVGRSHECDYPASVQRLPVCTEAKLNPQRSSSGIDTDVRELVRSGLSLYRVDPEQLRALAPDVVLTQDQCEVCAASLGDVAAALCAWTGARPRLISLRPATLKDIWSDIQRVADALDVPQHGCKLAGHLTTRVEAVAEQTLRTRVRPRAACLEWLEPLMGAGNWIPELVQLAGGEIVAGHAGQHSPWLSWEELQRSDPDVIISFPCGFSLARTRAELPCLTSRLEWGALRAVRTGRVFLADGNQFFNRPGPRIAESLEILAEILHPELFQFGHEGSGWLRA